VAFVIDSQAAYGLIRMHRVLGASPNLTVEIFGEPEVAEAWLPRDHYQLSLAR